MAEDDTQATEQQGEAASQEPAQSSPPSQGSSGEGDFLEQLLANESPEFKARVYKTLHETGVRRDDPLVLVLASSKQLQLLFRDLPQRQDQMLRDFHSRMSQDLEELTTKAQKTLNEQVEEKVDQRAAWGAQRIQQVEGETLQKIQEAVKKAIKEQKSDSGGTAAASWLLRSPWTSLLSVSAVVGIISLLGGATIAYKALGGQQAAYGRTIAEWSSNEIVKCLDAGQRRCEVWVQEPPEEYQKN